MAETKQARCNGIEQFKGWIEILIEQRYHRMDVREKKVVEWIDIFLNGLDKESARKNSSY